MFALRIFARRPIRVGLPSFYRPISCLDSRKLCEGGVRGYSVSAPVVGTRYPALIHLRTKSSIISASAPERENITERVLKVCSEHSSISRNKEKLTLDALFMEDMGLDSLEHLEIVGDIETEFGYEIQDDDAFKLLSPKDIVEFILLHAHEVHHGDIDEPGNVDGEGN